MSTRKSDYTTLSTPGTKKISVCARRVGSKDRMSVIAVCTDEISAEKICDGLNLLQGEMVRLETPAQRVLAEVRGTLASANDRISQLARDKRELESKLQEKSNEIGRLNVALQRAELARDAAQKTALENASVVRNVSRENTANLMKG